MTDARMHQAARAWFAAAALLVCARSAASTAKSVPHGPSNSSRTVPALRRARHAVANGRRADRAGADHGRAACRPSRAGAARRAGARQRVVVSIFVNPTQFAPHEDFATYPRTFDADVAALADTGGRPGLGADRRTSCIRPGFATRIVPAGPATAGLEDTFRPHFFAGVTTVVGKLLIQCAPDFAMFGEKDYQQLKVVTRMAKDLDLPVKIVGVPTVREPDGLALSSRNAYLSASDRAAAPDSSSRAQGVRRQRSRAGEHARARARRRRRGDRSAPASRSIISKPATPTRSSRSTTSTDGPIRLLVAARIGKTRLIDNIAV